MYKMTCGDNVVTTKMVFNEVDFFFFILITHFTPTFISVLNVLRGFKDLL